MSKIPRGYKLVFFLIIYIVVVTVFAGALINLLNIGPGFAHLTIIFQVIMFFVPFVAYLVLTKQRVTDVLPLRPLGLKNLCLIVGITFTTLPMAGFLSAVTSLFVTNYVAEVLTHVTANYPLWLALLAIGVAPSLFEELMFRGAVYKEFAHLPIKKAALLNGLFFGIIHMNLQQFFYAFALGVLFSYFLYYTGSILAPIIAHFVINGFNTILIFSIPQELLEEAEQIPYYQQPSPIMTVVVMGVLSLIFVPLFVFLLRDLREHNKEHYAL
ncbi:MAG: CPBP family intramembrane metalloprotease [Defluviitaleaceae bacterium]|nr:CPBP family intramembrane metalloprotease [Defluviitaleaceae bacterium]